jgi:hypothetical protein
VTAAGAAAGGTGAVVAVKTDLVAVETDSVDAATVDGRRSCPDASIDARY